MLRVPFHASSSSEWLWFLLLLLCSLLSNHNLTVVIEAKRGWSGYSLAQTIAKVFLTQPPTARLNTLGGHDGGTIKVIGAGFSRTGRLARALEELGYSPFGFWNAFLDNGSTIHWDDFLNDYNRTELIQNITAQGFNAVVDFPGCLLYKELMNLYPDSKIILSVRRGSESTTTAQATASLNWADDFLGTVLRVVQLSYRKPFSFLSRFNDMRNLFERWIFVIIGIPVVKVNKEKSLVLPRREALAAAYSEWVETVRTMVPPDRLLIHSSNDGWRPLCDFLSPMDPFVKKRCQALMNTLKFPIDDDATKWITAAAVMTLTADAYDRLPLLVLLLVGLVNGVLIFTTRRRSSNNRAKEKSE